MAVLVSTHECTAQLSKAVHGRYGGTREHALTAQLSKAVHCGQIWRYSDGNSSGSLDKPKFYVFMRLVSLALQKLRVPSTHSSAHAAYPTSLACTSQFQQEQPLARSRPCRVDPSRFPRAVQEQHWAGGVPHHRSRLRSFLRRCRCKLGPRRRAPPLLHGLLRRAVLSLAVHRSSSRSRQSLWSGWRCTARCRTFIRRLRGMSRTRCAARFPS